MVIRELVNKSTYGTIGYIDSQKAINQVEAYIQYNLLILQEFQNIIIATNFNSFEWVEAYESMWRSYFPECVLITSPENRGHNHGYVDLDNLVFNYCKENNIEWLCKSANDTIMTEDLLNKQVGEADFYYLNGIGVGGMVKYEFDDKRIIDEDFYPQTNFYFINVSKTDYINDKQYADETYEYIKSLPEYNGRIWEYIDGWSCELFLSNCVQRNNLKKEHLIPEEKYVSLLHSIKRYNIHDCSHKNIMIEGVFHFHFPEQNVLYI
jgi:GT2 family glycosyltransferase